MVNPMMALFAGQNPDMAADMLARVGAQVPIGGAQALFNPMEASLGGLLTGGPAGQAMGPGMMMGPAPTQGGVPAQAAMTPGGALGGNAMGDFAQLMKGVKAPQVPKPTMRAGVSGAQQGMPGTARAPNIMQLLQLMQAQGGSGLPPTPVPALGALLGGV